MSVTHRVLRLSQNRIDLNRLRSPHCWINLLLMRRNKSLGLQNAAKVLVDASHQLSRETCSRILSGDGGIRLGRERRAASLICE
jgi:hypothetical protein